MKIIGGLNMAHFHIGETIHFFKEDVTELYFILSTLVYIIFSLSFLSVFLRNKRNKKEMESNADKLYMQLFFIFKHAKI